MCLDMQVDPETHNNVTIFFCDIIGYTNLSSSLAPAQVMDMLDRLYAKFDVLCTQHKLFKVETIGDA